MAALKQHNASVGFLIWAQSVNPTIEKADLQGKLSPHPFQKISRVS